MSLHRAGTRNRCGMCCGDPVGTSRATREGSEAPPHGALATPFCPVSHGAPLEALRRLGHQLEAEDDAP
eukprot:5643285-Alexandrium_andersonii.AAC.1